MNKVGDWPTRRNAAETTAVCATAAVARRTRLFVVRSLKLGNISNIQRPTARLPGTLVLNIFRIILRVRNDRVETTD